MKKKMGKNGINALTLKNNEGHYEIYYTRNLT